MRRPGPRSSPGRSSSRGAGCRRRPRKARRRAAPSRDRPSRAWITGRAPKSSFLAYGSPLLLRASREAGRTRSRRRTSPRARPCTSRPGSPACTRAEDLAVRRPLPPAEDVAARALWSGARARGAGPIAAPSCAANSFRRRRALSAGTRGRATRRTGEARTPRSRARSPSRCRLRRRRARTGSRPRRDLLELANEHEDRLHQVERLEARDDDGAIPAVIARRSSRRGVRPMMVLTCQARQSRPPRWGSRIASIAGRGQGRLQNALKLRMPCSAACFTTTAVAGVVVSSRSRRTTSRLRVLGFAMRSASSAAVDHADVAPSAFAVRALPAARGRASCRRKVQRITPSRFASRIAYSSRPIGRDAHGAARPVDHLPRSAAACPRCRSARASGCGRRRTP